MRMLQLKKLAAAWLCLVCVQLCGFAIANDEAVGIASSGQAAQLGDQALPANELPPQPSGQPAPVNNHQPEVNHQAPPANDQLPVGNNQLPPVNAHHMQPDNHASPKDLKDPQANNQVPQVDQSPVANSHAPFNNEGWQNNAPMQQASNDDRAAPPVHRDQIVPTHGSLPPPPNGQRWPPPPEGRIPPPGWAPPPRPPPPPPPPPPKHRVPAFLIPSSEMSDTFDSAGASFVYILPSRRRQCFHHRSAKPFTFEYSVLHGGKLDINAYVVGPDGRIVYESHEPREGRYVVPALAQKETAINDRTSGGSADLPLYTICLDNRYASWYAKVVDFRIQLVPSRRRGSDKESEMAKGPLSEELTLELNRLNVSWTHFLELTDALEDNLYQSVDFQRKFRSEETRDRMAMEDSAYCVTMWSLLQLIVMTAVSALQVLMIRALFDEKSVFHRVWRSK